MSRTRALWAALGAVLITTAGLAACARATSDPQLSKSTVASNIGRLLNCDGAAEATNLPRHDYDINGDDVIDHFVAMRCPDQDGDQLEVFTGERSLDGPHRLGGDNTKPIVHRDKNRNLDDGCLMFSGQTVFVAEGPRTGDPVSAQVTWIGHWDSKTKRVETKPNTEPLTIPCGAVWKP